MKGLIFVPNFLSDQEQADLIKDIEAGIWVKNRTGSRPVQIFGPYHDKNYRIIRGKFSPHPTWYPKIAAKLATMNIVNRHKLADPQKAEIYVNKYTEKHGLRPHFDHRATYDEAIYGLSLGADCTMTFICGKDHQRISVPKGSLYIMTGESRHKYKHSITPGDVNGTRISVTVRTVA